MYLKSGGKPQNPISENIVANCDAGIAFFWHSLGSPTDTCESGTVEDIGQTLNMGRWAFPCFLEGVPPCAVAEKRIDA